MSSPLFSVVTPLYDTPVGVLEDTIASVLNQTYENWQLILVDDCSSTDVTRRVATTAAALDHRVRVIERSSNGGIVAASNDGVEAAQGEYIALLDHDDLLAPEALTTMAEEIHGNPYADYLYSDEDKIAPDGTFFGRFQKPDWSPERLRHQMYTGHLSVLRAELVREVGSFRPGFDGSQDHDLVLRVSERARSVVHVPQVLYHWRVVAGSAAGMEGAKPYAWEAGRRAVQDHMDRLKIPAKVGFGRFPGRYSVVRDYSAVPTVSLIVPTRGGEGRIWGERRSFVVDAVRNGLERTTIDPEVVIVHDVSTPDHVLRQLRELCGDRLVTVPFAAEFNFSAKCNEGFLASSGDVVVLMNDDVEAISDNWLEELVSPLLESDVGMTGAKLYFSDGMLQHAGHRYHHSWNHAGYGQPDDAEFEFGAYDMNREMSGVTAACAALRREVFEHVGGLYEGLPGSFNDVDLSYKLRYLGYRIVLVAGARLYHFESRTRESTVQRWEIDTVHRRWGQPGRDPYAPVG